MGALDGKTLGHFRVERLIGSGGMGAVYEAVDEKLERNVALKVLLHEGDSALNRKRFLREARLAAKLTHPNIATVFEVGEFESHLYIVMELLEGQSLRKLLTSRRLANDEALGVARDVVRALARAHAAGVTHRDIKPENVFITTPAPQVLHAKVLDFGLARQQKGKPQPAPPRSEEHTATDATAPGEILGTPGYWSPEQARSGEVDARTDVFSFGLLLYELITGRRAFKANSTVALVLAVTRHEPEPMRKFVPTVEPALEQLVARCIAKDPSQRFADGGELLVAIEQLARISSRASHAELDDTAADPQGPPVVRPASNPDLPRAREGVVAAAAPTDGATTLEDSPVAPVDRVRLFAAIGAGFAVAGLLLILIVAVWGGSGRAKGAAPALAAPSAAAPEPAAAASTAGSAESPVVAPPPAASAESAENPAPAPAPALLVAPAVSMIPTPLAVPAATAPVAAAPAAPAPAGAPAAPGGHAPVPRARAEKKADCAQPFTIDAKGVKIPKLHCL